MTENNNFIKVVVDLREGSDKERNQMHDDSFWRAKVYNVSETEIEKHWEDYNEQYYNEEFDGAWEDYLDDKEIRYELYSEEYDVFLEQM